MSGTIPPPEERSRTIRQQILEQLARGPCHAAELSRLIRKPEREITEHLDELVRARKVQGLPAACAGCGFRFEDRKRAKKPGKCPRCKSTRIRPPRFALPE